MPESIPRQSIRINMESGGRVCVASSFDTRARRRLRWGARPKSRTPEAADLDLDRPILDSTNPTSEMRIPSEDASRSAASSLQGITSADRP
jgi:hypothetical protein